MGLPRKLGFVALVAGGVILILPYAGWYSGGGGPSPSFWVSSSTASGVLCLLIASGVALTSYKDTEHSVGEPNPVQSGQDGSRVGTVAPAFGGVLALSTLFIAFPVGCNTAPCYMDPQGAWSTIIIPAP
jgi:hypothetical protein